MAILTCADRDPVWSPDCGPRFEPPPAREILAVPRGLEPPTFGLGKRCGGPTLSPIVPPKPDLSTFFGTAIPAHTSICHPIPYNWVAIWVATSLPYQGIAFQLGPGLSGRSEER